MFKQLLGLLDAEVATTIFKVEVRQQAAEADVPVETALTRAAEQASTNAVGVQGNPGPSSRSERRAAAKAMRPIGVGGTTKKKKKRR